MRRLLSLAVLLLITCAPAASAAVSRYSLANGCYALRSQAAGKLVAKDGHGGYAASAAAVGAAEPIRMQATALGHYLLYGRDKDYLAGSPSNQVETALQPSEFANWQVDGAGAGSFKLTLPAAGKVLATGDGGKLTLADAAAAGSAALFSFQPAGDCATFPEIGTSTVGTPAKGATPFGEVRGSIDAHMHMMAFEFLGGRAHCGKPWDPFGVAAALVDCPDHYPNGSGAVLENALSYGNPVRMHDPVGWPTFKDWPAPESLTHELSYYKWVERAWRGGLRTYVNLFVENKVLCEVYPYKQNSCDEMDAVRLQAKKIYELQDYIDAQYGGPGKGWFRIVKNPFQARRVINSGKLAVVLGIEVSEPFGCQVYNDQPQCDTGDIDRGLDEVYKLGVRDMEIINKFDNALGGVAGDTGNTGAVVNSGNKLETGKYWQMQTCHTQDGANDREQPTPFTHNTDQLLANGIAALVPPGVAPVYPPPPHCNARGLTSLGEHAIRGMIKRKMIVDPDHLSVLARDQVLSLLEAAKYSGVVSSHSWSTVDSFPRIYKLGGFVAPYAGASESFVKAWQTVRKMRDRKFYWGLGYGADMNGFGSQGGPRLGAKNPVTYPFKSIDGKVTLDRQHSGQRIFDINKDGVANYGLYPDWIQDLRMIAGNQIIRDMSRGPEAYLQMWERSQGVPVAHCQGQHSTFGARGFGQIALGAGPEKLLRSAGQPAHRPGRAWTYCVENRTKGAIKVVLGPAGKVAFIASSARGPRARGISAGVASGRLGAGTPRRGVVLRRTGKASLLFGVRGGKIRFVGVTTKPKQLGSYLKLAGLAR